MTHPTPYQTHPVGEMGLRTASVFSFDGPIKEFYLLYLKNIVLTLVTLGIYQFWAKVAVKKFLYQHTSFFGGRFGYHATGKEKFVGFLKGMLLLLPLIGFCAIVYFSLRSTLGPGAMSVSVMAFFFALILLQPLIIVGTRAFNLSRTSWNNIRFRFRGRVGTLYGIYMKGLLLSLLTFGVYGAWLMTDIERYKARNSSLGNTPFDYVATGGQFFVLALKGTFLSYVTLGIYFPWYLAALRRFHVDNLRFQGQSFTSNLTGGHLFGFIWLSLFAMVFSLGTALPWLIIRYNQMLVETTQYDGQIDIDSIRAAADAAPGATLEGLGAAGEALESIGELLGG